ncbi:hypothetical protein RAS1_36200 [Phycisphaerae bacterium RAS1]|nr:hypothetical protein RAS1_36200 [Phycisphaerae bacterium RAS1]
MSDRTTTHGATPLTPIGWADGAITVFIIALLFYGSSAWVAGRTGTPNLSYFDELADAFLKGRLDIPARDNPVDLTPAGGLWYVPFPPLPALVMLPWRVLGFRVNTVAFSVVFAAANVALLWSLLGVCRRRGLIDLGPGGRAWLAVLFAAGTVHWYVSVDGTVWYIAHIFTVCGAAAAACSAAAGKHPAMCGAFLALGMLARPHIALTWPLLYGLSRGARNTGAAWIAASLSPMAAAALVLLAYNAARFGDPLDFGYARQHVGPEVIGDLNQYGQFHPHFVARNLWAMLLALPAWDPKLHMYVPDPLGMSLLLTTPPVVYLAATLRSRGPLVLGAWVALLLLLVPLMLYYNTGWKQFGYRFSLDFVVPTMLLIASALRGWVNAAQKILIVVAVLVNAWGGAWFYFWKT